MGSNGSFDNRRREPGGEKKRGREQGLIYRLVIRMKRTRAIF